MGIKEGDEGGLWGELWAVRGGGGLVRVGVQVGGGGWAVGSVIGGLDGLGGCIWRAGVTWGVCERLCGGEASRAGGER